ncbi:MAG: hypothetical protein EB121_03005 [Alphaproteobacteria bacterium]|nr:hypothetical protein [Alphaproteobacteria bacterium]
MMHRNNSHPVFGLRLDIGQKVWWNMRRCAWLQNFLLGTLKRTISAHVLLLMGVCNIAAKLAKCEEACK